MIGPTLASQFGPRPGCTQGVLQLLAPRQRTEELPALYIYFNKLYLLPEAVSGAGRSL